MAKPRHDTPTSSKAPMAILAGGGILVAALVVWALTRTVEPAASTLPTAATTATTAALETVGTATGMIAASDTTATTTTSTIPVATNSAPPPAPPHIEGDRAEVQRIAVEDLRAQVNRGAVTVIDVRDANSYSAGHIAGALNIPLASIEAQLDTIPKDKPIVTYCT